MSLIVTLAATREKKHYNVYAGQMVTVKQSMKVEKERSLYESREKRRWYDAPPPGYGLDGYPLMPGKERNPNNDRK